MKNDLASVTLRAQMRCYPKSRSWIVLMMYLIIVNLINALFSASTFYYCNWVLGSYNDGVMVAAIIAAVVSHREQH